LYKDHCKNVWKIEKAIKLIQINLRRYISTEQEENEYIYTKLLSYLVTCWSEVRILKLTHEQSAFTQREIDQIKSSRTLKGKWLSALNISICKAYNINITNDQSLISRKLDFTPRRRYEGLIDLIQNDLLESISVRNRIAHGQWWIAFTRDLKNTSKKLTAKLHKENIVNLQLQLKLFISLGQIIHDLAVSPATFERDFDINYKKIEQQRNNLHNRDYNKYKQKMREKYQRGLLKRRKVSSSP